MTRKFFYGWWVVLASGIGVGCGVAVFIPATVGVLAGPLQHTFGWSPQTIFTAPTVATTTTIAIAPFLGALVDRIGARRIILFSYIAEALIIGSFHYLTPSPIWFLFRYALLAIFATGTTAVAFAAVISKWFDRHRGLALGVALAGIGIGGVVWSLLTQTLSERYGWRNAMPIEAAVILLVALPLLLIVIKESPQQMGLTVDGDPLESKTKTQIRAERPQGGMTLAEAIRTRPYWLILLVALLTGFGVQSIMLHLVSILKASGESPRLAAQTQATLWIALVLGRTSTGWLMDRFFAPRVAAAFLVPPIIGIFMLANGAINGTAVVAAMLVGLAAGAEVDVIAFLCSRYFGLRNYSRIYATFFSFFALGSGFGPMLTARLAAGVHGYPPVLHGLALVLFLAALIFFLFPKFTPFLTFSDPGIDPTSLRG